MRPTERRSSETFASVLYSLADEPAAAFCLGAPGRAEWERIPFADRGE
ncbi:hypothetical protein [Streptomyces sp. NPDC000994]